MEGVRESVHDWAADRIEATRYTALPAKVVRDDYEEWCRKRDIPHLNAVSFGIHFAHVCAKARTAAGMRYYCKFKE